MEALVRMLPLLLLAAGWVMLRAMNAASTVGLGFERVAARALVVIVVCVLVIATAGAMRWARAAFASRSSRAVLAGAAAAHLALQAFLGGALRPAGHLHAARVSLGETYGPLTVWPSVILTWPEAGLALSVSAGHALLSTALAFTFGACAVIALDRWKRARSCEARADAWRPRAAAAAWLPATLGAGACAGCLPSFFAVAPAAAGAFAPLVATLFDDPTALAPTLLQASAPPVALASLLLLRREAERARHAMPQVRAPVVAAVAAPLLLPVLAVAGLPSGASTAQRAIHEFFLLATAAALFLLVPVFALGVYYALRYRARAGASAGGRTLSRRGKRAVLAAAILIPALVVYGLGVVSYQVLVELEEPPQGTYYVEVTGSQFEWLFTYPDGLTSVDELRVPVDEVVVLNVTTEDVIHSFFVPDLGVKADALPGSHHQVWFRAIRTGTFAVHCAEFCGRGHAEMEATVIVERAS